MATFYDNRKLYDASRHFAYSNSATKRLTYAPAELTLSGGHYIVDGGQVARINNYYKMMARTLGTQGFHSGELLAYWSEYVGFFTLPNRFAHGWELKLDGTLGHKPSTLYRVETSGTSAPATIRIDKIYVGRLVQRVYTTSQDKADNGALWPEPTEAELKLSEDDNQSMPLPLNEKGDQP